MLDVHVLDPRYNTDLLLWSPLDRMPPRGLQDNGMSSWYSMLQGDRNKQSIATVDILLDPTWVILALSASPCDRTYIRDRWK